MCRRRQNRLIFDFFSILLGFDCCVPDSIVAVTPKPGFECEYLYHYLLYLRSHLEHIAPQSAQKNINLGILSPLPTAVLPMPEQRRIVAYLDGLQAKVDALKKLQAETAAELDALLPSILDRAFRGELVGAVREPPLRAIAADTIKHREAGSTA